jgi:hypothetical protein
LAKDGLFDGVDVTGGDRHQRRRRQLPPSAWLKRVEWPFPVMADDATATAASAYGINVPYFAMVDADGKVAARSTGEISGRDHRQHQGAQGRRALPLVVERAPPAAESVAGAHTPTRSSRWCWCGIRCSA